MHNLPVTFRTFPASLQYARALFMKGTSDQVAYADDVGPVQVGNRATNCQCWPGTRREFRVTSPLSTGMPLP